VLFPLIAAMHREANRVNAPIQADAIPSNRRQFAQQVAVLAAAPLALQGPAQAQQAFNPVMEALHAIVTHRYSKYLTPAQLVQVKQSVARNQLISDELRKVKLNNNDEPAFAFRADLP
jgi:hypothetical protein